MTLDGWRAVVRQTAYDPEQAELVAQLLYEQDHAKARLQNMGIGCTGRPWAGMVDDVEEAVQRKAR